jgi:hypothetical protein
MKVKILVLRKNGNIDKIDQDIPSLPSTGDGIMVGSTGCEVRGHVYTPHLAPTEYHIFVSEC